MKNRILFLGLAVLGLFSCKPITKDVAPEPLDEGDRIETTYYFKIEYPDGTLETYQEGKSYNGGTLIDFHFYSFEPYLLSTPNFYSTFQTGIGKEIEGAGFTTNDQFGAYFISEYGSSNPTLAEIEPNFAYPQLSFVDMPVQADTANKTIEPGVILFYIDNDGVEYRSDYGVGGAASQPSNAQFNILEFSNISDPNGQKALKASFKCRLYTSSGENYIDIEKGLMRVSMIPNNVI